MGRSVVLVVNQSKPEARDAAGQVREMITRRGTLVRERDTHDPEPFPECDLLVVLGGDGTLLGQARRLAGSRVPMLGVNFGKLGFMAEFDLESLDMHAEHVFGNGSLSLKRMPKISVRVFESHATTARFEAVCLKEAVVPAGPPFRVITVTVAIDGVTGPTFSGDGLIVSTPLGSTAYNLSAGGPIVAPGVDALTLTPIAAHTLSFRPLVVPSDSPVELRLHRVNEATAENQGTTLVLDGQILEPLREHERVRIESSPDGVWFVLNPRATYWDTLISKLHWAASPLAPE